MSLTATTFTRTLAGIYDAINGVWSAPPSTITIAGNAIQVRGNPQRYQAKGLEISTMPTLFWTPATYGLRAFTPDCVLPGDTVVWAGITYSVKDVEPISPDGIVIAARIIVSS